MKRLIYGNKIAGKSDLFKAISSCHAKGIQTVIISSSKAFDSEKLVLYASQKDDANLIQIEFDKLPGTFYGTGDAFAAMVLAWLTRLNDLKVS
jgi:pyridoxal/pyridoxine/pyridoxamine kinase